MSSWDAGWGFLILFKFCVKDGWILNLVLGFGEGISSWISSAGQCSCEQGMDEQSID